MNQKLTWGAVLMLGLATMAGPALADNDRRGGYRDHDRREHRRDHRETRRDHRGDRRDYSRDRRHDRRDNRYDRRHDRRDDAHYRPPVRVIHHRPVVRHHYPAPRYVAPPRWARGGYVHHYHRPIHVVHDYRGYGLRHPPRGYRWMRDDYGDLLLVAIATGLIADLVLNR